MNKKLLNKNFMIIIGILIVISIFGVNKFRAEFFDVFGLITFSFLTFVGGWMILSTKKLPKIISWIILGLGLLGLVVDGGILLKLILNK